MKAVIFDMDGVLINTEPLHYRCWKEILKEKNGIDLDYEVYLPCIGSTVDSSWIWSMRIMGRFLMMWIR